MEQDRKARDREPEKVWVLVAAEASKVMEMVRDEDWAVAQVRVGAKVRVVDAAKTRKTTCEVSQKRRKERKMPRGNGTGPMGQGPMTGRAAGYCAGNAAPGFANPSPGRGSWGRGRGGGGGGGGWGRRNQFYATGLTGWQREAMGETGFAGPGPYMAPFAPAMPPQQELDLLKGQTEYFEDALNGIKNRIAELEAKTQE